MLRACVRLEAGAVVLRTEALRLPVRDRRRADTVCRRLWPGLVPVPHRPVGRHG